MPPRNAPLPNAVNLFNCAICDKGYPRQTDYENHLRSYDHNHRQRLADMKKLTDANASDAPRSKAPLDMRTLPQQTGDAAKMGLGPRFKKVGATAQATGGSRFKKIGEPKDDVHKEETPKVSAVDVTKEVDPVPQVEVEAQLETSKDEHVVTEDDEEDEAITWVEYDVTKPSDCEHASCPGCAPPANPVYENGWLVMGSA